ncbi:DUF7475 family protein [Halocatena pleomorpha]|uniref:DoxX family protein n=1 Tax=Halocatena pleomorpha TaxID=1785090 RepID=A0A3P3RJT2_9EURY|nr:hypothetical protein [Halocatena pleomorpha]RRJ33761.1 hypothetical protein EIK79_02940 [Halocatena pleomorpha]
MSRPETNTESLTTLHWIAIGLTIITGVIHLVLGIMAFPGVLPTAFLLAGIGFFAGIGLLLLGYRRSLYIVGVPFVAVQIVLYLWINQRAG